MTRCVLPALALVLSSSFAAPAAARPIEFSGTLTIDLLFPFGSAVHFAASGQGVADVTVTDGLRAGVTLPASVFVADTSAPVADPLLAPISGQALDLGNEAGSFGRVPLPTTATQPSRLEGRMPLRGFAKLCLFSTCSAPTTLVSLPLGPVGFGGIGTGQTPVLFTLAGAAWTTGPVFLPSHGFFTGSSTPNVLSLVTPILISTSNLASGLAFVPALGRLRLEFAEPVPEPQTFLLVGCGIAALAGGIGRKRRSVRHS